jgi:hypothetical protein
MPTTKSLTLLTTTTGLRKRKLRRAEAAEVFGVSEDYIKRIPLAELPVERISRRLVLYDVNDLEAYFSRYRVVA